MLVLIPGIGREFNGSTRWLGVGPMTIQPSELVKLFAMIYSSGLFSSTPRRSAEKVVWTDEAHHCHWLINDVVVNGT